MSKCSIFLLLALPFFIVVIPLSCDCHSSVEVSDDLLVNYRSGAIEIDGVINEDAWRKASTIGPLKRADGRTLALHKTEVWLTWDEEHLFFAFRCEDPDIFSTYTNRDDPLYLQEVVEVFLDPDSDRRDYVEFEVSPAGVLFDASFTGRRQGMNLSYNPTINVAVKVNGTINQRQDQDREWVVEMAIPFLGMTGRGKFPPEVGDRWRMNIFRIDKSGSSEEASSWKPTTGDFHDLNAFGVIRFSR